MSYDQKTISNGLNNMPYNIRFKVPLGALPFIVQHIDSRKWGGGVFLNEDYSEYYKCRVPEI
jgi:hypothetical protein